jgi:hypothetical protein
MSTDRTAGLCAILQFVCDTAVCSTVLISQPAETGSETCVCVCVTTLIIILILRRLLQMRRNKSEVEYVNNIFRYSKVLWPRMILLN